uniref:Uncharacterized protein n=1 Tax=Panagrolaimus superbus TaxID=310955 RepID=A0A914XS71_9BILA
MPSLSSRSMERQNTLIFLQILKNYYPQIVESSDKIPLWEKVLEECQNRGIFMDKTADYLAQKRWPASVGIVRKASKKRGPLSEKDQLIVEIERYRTPDFCYGKIEGDNDDSELTNDDSNITVRNISGDSNILTGESSNNNETIDERDNNDHANVIGGNIDDIGDNIIPMVAAAAANNINDIINEPNESLRNEYFQAAIRAFNAYSELTEIKLRSFRSRN